MRPRTRPSQTRRAQVLLELMSVDTSDVLFAEDIPLGSPGAMADVDPAELRLVLTDHNELCEAMRGWSRAVEEVVDHHRDARAHAHVVGAARRIDFDEAAGAGVGSACTLVAHEFAARAPALLEPAVAGMLMGAWAHLM